MDEKKIPKHILEIMNSMKTVEFNTAIEKKYKLRPEQIHKLAILESKVFYKELALVNFPITIKNQLNLDAEIGKSIAFNICQTLFLPAQPYLLGVKELMARLKTGQPQARDPNIVDLKNQ